MARAKQKSSKSTHRRPLGLRIIGGHWRGRKLQYSGDQRTRPMKDRLREAIFNLVGPAIKGRHAIDLFAGTGALGLEALSRGAARATLIEQHFPTAALITRNAAELGAEAQVEVVAANTFLWYQSAELPQGAPWVVFCSPPYDFYVSRKEAMLEMLGRLIEVAPRESLFVVEADSQFDFAELPSAQHWDVRRYAPAVVGIYETPGA